MTNTPKQAAWDALIQASVDVNAHRAMRRLWQEAALIISEQDHPDKSAEATAALALSFLMQDLGNAERTRA